MTEIDFSPPEAVRKAAKAGLAMRKKHGRGGTAVGVARARDLSNGKKMSPSTIRRMHSFFARHEVDKNGKGWKPGTEGYPSAGRVAFNLWGGAAGKSWAAKIVRQLEARKKKGKKKRSIPMESVERRFVSSNDGSGLTVEYRHCENGERQPVIRGTAIVWNSESRDLGGFFERIAPTALDRFFEESRSAGEEMPDIAALWNHDTGTVLGRTPKTLRLHRDDVGLHFELEPPASQCGIVESVARGDIRGASFAFVCGKDGEQWTKDDAGRSLRTITDIEKLFEVSLVLSPAYEATSLSVARRSLDVFHQQMNRRDRVRSAIERTRAFLEQRNYEKR